jgi:hypothetical protein
MPAGLRLSALAVLLLVLSACSDSSGPEGTPQDLSGTYTIVSFSQGTSGGVILVPGASGTVTLTATAYAFDVVVPPLHIVDNGTYTAVGTATTGTWTQESTDDPTFQSTGTYTVDPATNRLTLDTTVQGTRNVIEMQKT